MKLKQIKQQITKYVLVPTLCVAILVGTISNSMASAVEIPVSLGQKEISLMASAGGVMSPEDYAQMIKERQEKEKDNTAQSNTTSNTTGDTRVEGGAYDKGGYTATHTNFLKMRKSLEKLTGTKISGDRGYGPLYTGKIMGTGQEVDGLARTKIQEFTGTRYYLTIYRGEDMQVKVRELAAEAFPDVKATDWFASYIPEAVYHNLINGYEDGTFKGNNNVTFAEFAKMLRLAKDEDAYMNYDINGLHGVFTGQWYAPFMTTLTFSSKLDLTNVNSKIPRGLVAFEICMNLLQTEYMNTYRQNNIGVKPQYWTDIEKVVKDYLTYDLGDKTYDKMREQCNNVKEVPENIYVAMELLRKYGVMVGNEKQESRWNEPITRAEAVKLIIETYTKAWYGGVKADK